MTARTAAILCPGFEVNEDALDVLGEPSSAIDVVFSDVVMPGMSGLGMARIIRERHPVPVILTSGYSDVIARDGHNGFELVPRPYSIDTLSRVLRRVMARPDTERGDVPPV